MSNIISHFTAKCRTYCYSRERIFIVFDIYFLSTTSIQINTSDCLIQSAFASQICAPKKYSIVKENKKSHSHDENLSWEQFFNLYANVTISREESVVDPHRVTRKVIDSRVFPRFHLRHFYAVTLAEKVR